MERMPARSSASRSASTRLGRRHAGRVAEREPVGARVDEVAGDLRHPLGRDVALVGAAERGRDDRLDRGAGVVHELGDLVRGDERLGDRPPHVVQVVRLARAHHELHLVGGGRDRALGAPHVGHERRVGHSRPAGDLGHHVLGAGHGRDRARRDERRGLDAAQAGGRQGVDEPDPLGDRDRRLVLQAVARPDLTNVRVRGPGTHHLRLRVTEPARSLDDVHRVPVEAGRPGRAVLDRGTGRERDRQLHPTTALHVDGAAVPGRDGNQPSGPHWPFQRRARDARGEQSVFVSISVPHGGPVAPGAAGVLAPLN